mmetsp:Transcript_25681/g.51439  ORF Transcript_25681/g.51439 Transcript_25681/m.51439 type:complete len:124 (-) Transcript_25681:268-639(-)
MRTRYSQTCLHWGPLTTLLQFLHTRINFSNDIEGTLLPSFPKTFKAISQGIEDGGVFVYCPSRQASSALVTGYLMATQRLSFDDAWRQVLENCSECEDLNRNLKRQLTTWAKWPEFPGLPEWM